MIRGLAAALLLASVTTLGGCSSTIADLPTGGSKEAHGYLPVHDLPPERNEAAITPADQAKIEAELKAARDRQAAASAAQNGAGK